MMSVRVCCTPEVAPGFWLAGLPVAEARDRREAGDVIAADPGALWLVQEALDPDLPHLLVVPFPDPRWEDAHGDDRVLEILRRAIGYRVRL
jgi:vacuolar-type H+-ATPase subunit F/Vma7